MTPYKAGIQDRALPDVSAAERAVIERHNSEIDSMVAEANKRLAELRRPYQQRLFAAKLAAIPEVIRADTRTAIETTADKRNEIQKYLVSQFEEALKVSVDEILPALDDSDKATNSRIVEQIVTLTSQRRVFGKIQALFDVGPPPATHLLLRGNHETPGPEVQPGFLNALGDAESHDFGAPTPSSATSGRRTALARWLTRPDSASASLMARVMVNRIWQHLLGEGLVPTPENFGSAGEAPTHPDLLDWLSVEFMQNGWQVSPDLSDTDERTMVVPHYFQSNEQTCGAACLRMVLAALGVLHDEATIAQHCGITPLGCTVQDLVTGSQAMGFNASLLPVSGEPAAITALSNECPFVAMIDSASLSGSGPMFQWHFVVPLLLTRMWLYSMTQPMEQISRQRWTIS